MKLSNVKIFFAVMCAVIFAPVLSGCMSEENGADTGTLFLQAEDTGGTHDRYQTSPVPEGKPLPVEPEDAELSDIAYKCTISISCATLLDNLDRLEDGKVELVPADGWLLEPTEVTFYEGESVFNLLMRTTKQQKLHMEFENTLIYNSAYIEGIGNIYEFDCGGLSGWVYSVNDWFPNYGASRYALSDGDIVNWLYTCDFGADVGGNNTSDITAGQ